MEIWRMIRDTAGAKTIDRGLLGSGRDTVDQVAGDCGTPKTSSEPEKKKQQEADLGGFGDQ